MTLILKNGLYEKFKEWCEDGDLYNPFETLRGFLAEARRQFQTSGIAYEEAKSNGKSYLRGIGFNEKYDNGEELLNDD